jgi:bisanhydrobacterioruberin hydratase
MSTPGSGNTERSEPSPGSRLRSAFVQWAFQTEGGLGLILAILYGVGVLGHLWGGTLPLMKAITPIFLPLTGVVALSGVLRGGHRGFWVWALLTFAVTYGLEVLGVWTGLVFGSYLYGTGMGPTILGVPPLIGANWVLVCLGALRLVQPLSLPPALQAGLAALLALGFDWVMEPVAIELGYWAWAGGAIPLQNYVAWFGIALGAGLLYGRIGDPVQSRLPAVLFLVQLGFFGALNLLLVQG